ncbi:MAG: type II toxin-antitoxin system PemK/MazF family toxin [Clostridia bacterium]|nr:type II toxin-antitoxin system PemK/MazF family toxin [Clostridia bacterium]
MKRGEIYYADLGESVGCEQRGKRPVLVVQNDIGNAFSPTIIVVPITSRQKTKIPTHARINTLREDSIALTEQVRTIDRARIKTFVCEVTEDEMIQVDRALAVAVGLLPVNNKGVEYI